MAFTLKNWPMLCRLNCMPIKLMIQLEWERYDKDTCHIRSNHSRNDVIIVGLTLETSAFNSLWWPIYIFNLVDVTKLPSSCYLHQCSTTVSLETFTLYSFAKFKGYHTWTFHLKLNCTRYFSSNLLLFNDIWYILDFDVAS